MKVWPAKYPSYILLLSKIQKCLFFLINCWRSTNALQNFKFKSAKLNLGYEIFHKRFRDSDRTENNSTGGA